MTEIKMENRKSNVCQNGDLGAASACHKIPDQVGDDRKLKCSGMTENIGSAGMTENIGSALTDSRLRRNDVLSHTCGERGRSMVEVLGVLAVMGVLSIGGVAGYRYAIDKMNANDIINEVRKRAVTASQQRILGHDINLSEYGDNGRIKGIHAVTATNDYAGDKGFFALTVSAVPQRVCDEILKQDWAMPVEMAVGGVVVDDATTCAEGDNELLFAFANTLDNSLLPGEGGEDDNESELEPCAEGEYRLSTGECVTDYHPECGNGTFYNNYTLSCTACPTEGNAVQNNSSSIEDTCEKCTGAQVGGEYVTYCVYCPSGVTCGDQCCGEEEKCQRDTSSGPYTYTCVSALGDGKCWTNADCNNDSETGEYYCQNGWGCQATIGTCETISSTSITINGVEYTASTDEMSYHAAENFCDALGKTLAPVTDGCTAEELAAVKANNYWGSCTGWARTTGEIYWTATKLHGCASYYVYPRDSGSVGSGSWGSNYFYYALCR